MSLRQCIVPGCSSREQCLAHYEAGRNADGNKVPITLHKFPKDLKQKWCDQLHLDSDTLQPDAAVCCLHFSERMFADINFFLDADSILQRKLKVKAYPDTNLRRPKDRITFDDATIVKILQAIKPHQSLWDPTSEGYWDEKLRTRSLRSVSEELYCEETDLLETITTIRKIIVQQLAALKAQPKIPMRIGWFRHAHFIHGGLTCDDLGQTANQQDIEVFFPTLCRICLAAEHQQGTVFEALQPDHELVDIFEKLTEFKVVFDGGDHLPTHICSNCKTWMLTSHSFVDRCQRTEVVLQKMYRCKDADAVIDVLTDMRASEIIEEVDSDKEEDERPTKNEALPVVVEPEPLEPSIDWIMDRNYETVESIWESFDQKAMNFELSTNGSFEDQLEPVIPELEPEAAQSATNVGLLCSYCGCDLTDESYDEHIRTCRLNPDATKQYYECFACPKRYMSKLRLLYHLRRKHYNTPDNYKCKFCIRVYTTNSALYAHVRQHHLQTKPFKCKLCNACYNFKYKLDNHTRSIHTKETPFACHLCPVRKSTSRQLYRHIETVHTENQQVRCNLCFKEFKQPRYLKAHAAMHLKEGNYKCPVCDTRFFDCRNMRNHCQRQHPDHQLPPKGTIIKEDYLQMLWAMGGEGDKNDL